MFHKLSFTKPEEKLPMQTKTRTADERPITGAIDGAGQEFSDLVSRYYGLVYSIGYARLGTREAAEELAQEVFLRTYLHRESLADIRSIGAWLTRVTRNLAEDWARREKR